jgi:hypothetical protein
MSEQNDNRPVASDSLSTSGIPGSKNGGLPALNDATFAASTSMPNTS